MFSNEKISELFRRTIFSGLEKIDITNVKQRKDVYEAALQSLENVHSKNSSLTDDVKTNQRSILSELIIDIETKIANINEKENFIITGSEPEPQIVSTLADEEYLLDDDVSNKNSASSSFDNMLSEPPQSRRAGKKLIVSTIIAFLAIVGLFAYYTNFEEAKNASQKLPLPYVLTANQALLDFARPKDKGSVKLADGLDGIIYEVDISNDETANRVDFFIRGELGKKILAHEEPILVTLHLQKISKEDITLNLLFRSIGKNVRKKVNIVDQTMNEFFLISNGERGEVTRSNAIIRLQVSPTSEKYEEKPILLLKKVVFSKI